MALSALLLALDAVSADLSHVDLASSGLVLYQQHPKLIHQWNIEMLSCESSKMHNYYYQNIEVHIGIETDPSQ